MYSFAMAGGSLVIRSLVDPTITVTDLGKALLKATYPQVNIICLFKFTSLYIIACLFNCLFYYYN